MRDEEKGQTQLIQEVQALRSRLVELEVLHTRYHQAERQSEQRRLYLESVFNCAPDAIVTSNEQGIVQDWNTGAERLFGYRADEAAGQHIDALIGGDAQSTRQVMQGQPLSPIEVERYRKDGTSVDVLVTGAPIRIEGRVIGAVAVYVDLHERKNLEAQLRQAQRMEAVGRLAGGIAHDFNNLLTAIQGYTEFLLDGLGQESASGGEGGQGMRMDLQEIQRVAERAETMIRQLLAFSRRQSIQPQVLDLNEVIGSVEKMLRRLIGEDIVLTVALAPGLNRVKADPGQLEQIVVNLAINARDAMPHGGRLNIETANAELGMDRPPGYLGARPGGYVLLKVSDTGMGMSSQVREHIFEPFFTTKSERQGTGLGLTNVYDILRQLGGEIYVTSEPGRGTAFEVYIPQAAEPIHQPAAHPAVGATPQGSEIILLVEDEDMVRELAQRILVRQGYTVISAHDPEEAVRLCQEQGGRVDLLVTDMVMPGGSGFDLAARLMAQYTNLRVLYMSGYAEEAVTRPGIKDTAPSFLKKPFTPAVLAQKVRQVLDTHPA